MSFVLQHARWLDAVRFWDIAATEPKPHRDPDWTAGALVARGNGADIVGEWFIVNMTRFRKSPKGVEDELYRVHELDDALLERHVPIRVEIVSAYGKVSADQWRRHRFSGLDFRGVEPHANKVERARPVSVAAEAGLVHLVDASWNEELLTELELFPSERAGLHDDQVDAISGAFSVLRPKAAAVAPKVLTDRDFAELDDRDLADLFDDEPPAASRTDQPTGVHGLTMPWGSL